MATPPSSSVELLQAYRPRATATATRDTATKRRNPGLVECGCQLSGVSPLLGCVTETRPPEKSQKQLLPANSRGRTHRKRGRLTSRKRRDASAPGGSRRDELHLLERGTAEKPVGTGERLEDLEMVVALGDEELYRLAGCLDRGGEAARLTLKLGRLQRPMRDDYRAAEPFERAFGAQPRVHLVGELDVGPALRSPTGMQVRHAAAQQ